LTPKDFGCWDGTPEDGVTSPTDYLQVLAKQYPNKPGKNSWHQLMPTLARLDHYRNSKLLNNPKEIHTVPEGWPGGQEKGLAQYRHFIKNKLYLDDTAKIGYFEWLEQQIYSTTNGKEPSIKVPMTPIEFSYSIIADCHIERDASNKPIKPIKHFGRDVTFDKVKKLSSTIPKAVVAGFITACPGCSGTFENQRGNTTKRKAESESAPQPAKRKRAQRQANNIQPQDQKPQQFNNEVDQNVPFPQQTLAKLQMGQINNEPHIDPQQFTNVPPGQNDNGETSFPDHINPALIMYQNNNGEGSFTDTVDPVLAGMSLFTDEELPLVPSPNLTTDQTNNGAPYPQQAPDFPMDQINNGPWYDPQQAPYVPMDQINNILWYGQQQAPYVPVDQISNGFWYGQQQAPYFPMGQINNGEVDFTQPSNLNNIDPTLENHSSDNSEQTRVADPSGKAPMDQNDNGEAGLGSTLTEFSLPDEVFDEVLASVRNREASQPRGAAPPANTPMDQNNNEEEDNQDNQFDPDEDLH
jgi:hypothetical protein